MDLCNHQRVTSSTGGQGQPQTGSVAVGAGQPVIDVDAVITDAERVQADALGGEILLPC